MPRSCPQRLREVSELPPKDPEPTKHEIPTNSKVASGPRPRHGGGMDPGPLDINMHESHQRYAQPSPGQPAAPLRSPKPSDAIATCLTSFPYPF
eukprot:480918-Pyramimonas_sp.AAC.1